MRGEEERETLLARVYMKLVYINRVYTCVARVIPRFQLHDTCVCKITRKNYFPSLINIINCL